MKLRLAFLLLWSVSAGAQSVIPQQMRAASAMAPLTSGSLLYGIPLPSGERIGEGYLDNHWNTGSVMLHESETMISGYPLKYDLKAQVVEIQSRTGIKVLDTRRIKSMVWMDSAAQQPRYFVSGKSYLDEGVPIDGLLEVLADGAIVLFKRTTVVVKPPDYVPALNVGSRDEKLLKRTSFYYAEGKQMSVIKSRKKLTKIFGDRMESVELFIDEKKLDIKDDSDLVEIFKYYNSSFPPAN